MAYWESRGKRAIASQRETYYRRRMPLGAEGFTFSSLLPLSTKVGGCGGPWKFMVDDVIRHVTPR